MDDQELRRRVVRIHRQRDGAFLGSGFFVAPGWVLTCAHVVGTEAGARLLPDASLGVPEVAATVLARSAQGVPGELWPFPDLALLQLAVEFEHPCVHLIADDPDSVEDCHAWGFPQHERGRQDPPGSPASFRFEGVDGNGFIQLKAGQAVPGLSGAPLVCPRHRGVFGVIQSTRGRDGDLGGWASPVSALLSGGAGIPRDLAAFGRQIREENRAAILADRAGWHRVLPIEGVDALLDRRWEPFVRQPGSSPAEMLRADYGVVPFLFRDRDLADLAQWCENGPAMAVAQITGDGGAGKTRFAIELCRRMADRGWIAGLWPDESDDWARRQALTVTSLPLPRLVVIDYAEVFAPDALRTTLKRLRENADPLAPVRVLLLVRTASTATRNPLHELRRRVPSPSLLTVLNAAGEYRALTKPLSLPERQALYTEAALRFDQAWFPPDESGGSAPLSPGAPDLSADRYALPLEVLFEAFDYALSGGGSADEERSAIEGALDHERKYWHAANPPAGLDANLRDLCVALCTLAGAADDAAANTLLVATVPALGGEAARELRGETVRWLAGLHRGPARLNALRPDRLGEALVAQVLTGRGSRDPESEAENEGSELLRKVLHLPSNDQLATCLDLLARLVLADPHVARCAATVLADLHVNLVMRAETQFNRRLQQPGHVTVASGLIRLLAGDFAEVLTEARPGDPGHLSELAGSYARLGDLAAKVEQNTAAERLYLHGIDIRKDLALAQPEYSAHQREIALLYERLGNLIQMTDGEVGRAERMYLRAVTIGRNLLLAEPDNPDHPRDLATYYERLGELARLNGQAQRAQAWLELSVAIIDDPWSVVGTDMPLPASLPMLPAVPTMPVSPVPTPLSPPALPSWDDPRSASRQGSASAGQAQSPASQQSQSPLATQARPVVPRPPSAFARAADEETGVGKVVTFYSYQGGVGSTMTLANIAWILAANGKRVLVSDWDLQSPGLHQFFRPFLEPDAVERRPGAIDLVREYQWATLSQEERPLNYHLDYARARKYAIPLDWDFPDGGCLDFLSAGRQDRDYSVTVSAVDWDEFYERQGGGQFFDALREDMRRNYDYTLIDSRTALSNVADFCTVHLPDVVLDCFTLSERGIQGAQAVARSVAAFHPDREIRILPVMMKVDHREREDVEAGRDLARARFRGFPNGLTPAEAARYWENSEIPYLSRYTTYEKLAVFADRPGEPGSMLSAMERLTGWITEGAVTALPPIDEARRQRVLNAFTRRRPQSPSELVLAYVPEDRMWADWIGAVLGAASFTVTAVDVTEPYPADLGEPGRGRTVAVVSPAFARSAAAVELADAVAGAHPFGSRKLLSVLVAGADPEASAEADGAADPMARLAELAGPPGADLTGRREPSAAQALLRALGSPDHLLRPLPMTGSARFPGSTPQVWNVPQRNGDFTGRNFALESARDRLGGENVLPVALHGLGGIGKTQIALEYAHRFKADYDLVWWVDAEHHDGINRSLLELAGRIGVRGGRPAAGTNGMDGADVVRELAEALRRGVPHSRWLLIFDNADDPADLRGFLPGGPGHVLITSRNPSWSQVADPFEVTVFQRDESAAHLLRRAGALDPADADDLAEALGDLPLAVEVVGAWLAETGLAAADYVELLDRPGSTRILSRSKPANYPRTLADTWKISFDRLAERSAAALRLMELCAFLAPEISADLAYGPQTLEALLPLDETLQLPMMLGQVVQEIGKLALARVNQQGTSIHIHPLIQSYLRDRMDAGETAIRLHEVHRILAAARPARGGVDDPANWPRFALIWPHLGPSRAAACDLEKVQQLLIDRVRYLWKIGDYNRGMSLALRLEDTWSAAALASEAESAQRDGDAEQVAQVEHPRDRLLLQRRLLHLRSQRANLHRSRGEIAQAAELDRAVLAEQRRLLPDGDPHTMFSAGGLAADLRWLGRFDEALALDQSTYATLKERVGEDDDRTLAAADNLATDLRIDGDWAAALSIDMQNHTRRQTLLGPAHPFTLTSVMHEACDWMEAGRYQRAATLLQPTYNAFLEALDENFGETLRTATVLGIALRRAGQHAEARAVTEDTCARFRQEFPADHLDGCAARLSLAADLAAAADVQGAMELARAVHADYQRLLGPRHPFACAAANNLAVYLARAGFGPESLALAQQCLRDLRETLGPDHRYTLTAELTVANGFAATHAPDDAARCAEDLFPRLAGHLGDEHPVAIGAALSLACHFEAIGAADDARGLRATYRPICVTRLGPEHPLTQAARAGTPVDHEIDPFVF
ncbi:MAG TPA: FxSxx-COOH system tetratricopeptide repeat protein [Actinocrinis sp.]|nr:FxSxx-COOH system tetratricopeptide repeat protein [Actinocrinis sp.]